MLKDNEELKVSVSRLEKDLAKAIRRLTCLLGNLEGR